DLTRRKVPLDPQQSSQTELAVDSTAHLAGNANRSAFPRPTSRFGLNVGLTTVPGFSLIALWHPDRFNRLSIGARHKVTHGSVTRFKFLLNPGQAYRESFFGQVSTKLLRQSENPVGVLNSLPVKGVKELSCPVGVLFKLLH